MDELFVKSGSQFLVNVDTLQALIPERFLNLNFCKIEETVTTFGIFDLLVNETELKGLLIPNIVNLLPKEIENVHMFDRDYICLTFHKGDVFMTTDTFIKNKFLIITMFKEFIELGNLPAFINYKNSHLLFSNTQSMADMDLNVNPVVLEMMIAYLTRSKDDLSAQQRYFPIDNPSTMIGLRNISYGPDSTTAKIFGSYSDDGMKSALVNPNDVSKPLEDIMRL